MRIARWLSLARKALRRPPGYVLARATQELHRQAYRPWSRVRPRLLTNTALLRKMSASSICVLWQRLADGPFFVQPGLRDEWRSQFREAFPGVTDRILAVAEPILRHEFDLLGSGPVGVGDRIPWQRDFKTARTWPLDYAPDIDYNDLDDPCDVKVPWELSRCQHFTCIGQAYWLTGDERYAREFVGEVNDWIASNPLAHGVNWACTMDVALRAISWIWGFYFFAESAACISQEFRWNLLGSLFLHGEYVAGNLEISEVRGNHYLAEGLGLVFLGAFFSTSRTGKRWLETGKRIVCGEIQSQVSEDGVDFEQSTSYHRLATEAFLTAFLLLRIRGEDPPAHVWDRLERMLEFVEAYTKPDGRAPLIGDADDGRIQKLGLQSINDHRYLLSTGAVVFRSGELKQSAGRFWEESFWLLGPPGVDAYGRLPVTRRPVRSAAFPRGGFYVMRGDQMHVVIDCAEVGMRGRGGHGHNDILSFEMFLNGFNLITDCGAYLYTASREWRNKFRSTRFHNTLQVDGEELNRFVHPDELWRLRYDAIPTEVTWETIEGGARLRAGHLGYTRERRDIVHYREAALNEGSGLLVFRDRVVGTGLHRLTWRFHLDPEVIAELCGADVRFSSRGREAWFHILQADDLTELRLEKGWVSPSYGVKTETSVLIAEAAVPLPVCFAYLFSSRYVALERRAEWLSLLRTDV